MILRPQPQLRPQPSQPQVNPMLLQMLLQHLQRGGLEQMPVAGGVVQPGQVRSQPGQIQLDPMEMNGTLVQPQPFQGGLGRQPLFYPGMQSGQQMGQAAPNPYGQGLMRQLQRPQFGQAAQSPVYRMQ